MDEGRKPTPHDLRPSPDRVLDSTVVAALYVEHGAELRRFVLGVVRDPHLASDVMQSTLARAIERGHTARPGRLKGWLFRVALNEALMARRRRAARDRAENRYGTGDVRGPASPEESLVRREAVERVRRVVDGLPVEQRRVVLARMYEEKSFAEIAREQGVPLGTVLTRMRLALERLRRALKSGE